MGSEEVQRIAQGFVTQRERSISGIRDAIWNRLSIVPTQNYFTSEFVPSTIDTSYGRYVVSVGLPKKEFITNEDHARWQSLAVEIDPAGDFGYPGHTLHPPDIKLLQEFYVRQIGIDLFKFRVYHDGIICLIKGSDTSVNVHPIPHLALIQELFEVSGYENSLSQPGLLTKRIVDKMGGLEEARVFKIRGVRKLIGQLTSTDAVTKGHPPT